MTNPAFKEILTLHLRRNGVSSGNGRRRRQQRATRQNKINLLFTNARELTAC